ncbi:MAG: zinc ribbon domain-containing protein [Defluviitaleaceae bacterium]|nr:zinc ribbon domain-containing protein [Defluviitaleaceae bacterium]
MFCEKCGQQKQNENVQFCSNCGANFNEEAQTAPVPVPQQPPATYAPPQPVYQPPTDQGNLLASGNGIQSNATMMWALYWGGAALLSIILAVTMGIRTIPGWFTTTTFINSWFYFWIFIAIAEITLGVLTVLSVRKSRIDVFEKGVAGVGLSKFYFVGDIRTFPFSIPHRDATVSTNKQEITITSAHNTYKAHAQNALQIRDAAYSQKQIS